MYGKDAREQGFIVVEKDELDMIDNFFSDPASCSWEVSSIGMGGFYSTDRPRYLKLGLSVYVYVFINS